MGNSLFGGLFKVTAAAAAVAGIAYLFKDEIKGTEAYQTLNNKYDVDTKLSQAAKKAKEAAYVAKDKAKEAAVVAKDKAYDLKDKAKDAYKKSPWASGSDEDIFEDDEIVLNEDGAEETRDYVEIKTDEAADAVKEEAEKAADATSDTVKEAVDKLDDVIKSVEEQAGNTIDNIELP